MWTVDFFLLGGSNRKETCPLQPLLYNEVDIIVFYITLKRLENWLEKRKNTSICKYPSFFIYVIETAFGNIEIRYIGEFWLDFG